jgi:hypothetical protein
MPEMKGLSKKLNLLEVATFSIAFSVIIRRHCHRHPFGKACPKDSFGAVTIYKDFLDSPRKSIGV